MVKSRERGIKNSMGATISIAFVEYHVIKNDMKIIRRIYNAGGEFRYKGNVWSGFVCNGNLRIVTLFDTISINKFSIQVYWSLVLRFIIPLCNILTTLTFHIDKDADCYELSPPKILNKQDSMHPYQDNSKQRYHRKWKENNVVCSFTCILYLVYSYVFVQGLCLIPILFYSFLCFLIDYIIPFRNMLFACVFVWVRPTREFLTHM